MADSAQESFNMPPGFALEEIKGELYDDDIGEDDELWLIRMPNDIELSTLDKQKIFLPNNDGDVSVKNIVTEGGKSLECFAETCEISNTSIVLPRRQDGQLSAIKKIFKGAILVSEGLSLNSETEIKAEKEDFHLNGNSCSVTELNQDKVVKKKRKSHSDLATNELEINNGNIDAEKDNDISISKKKKSKKKKHSHTDFDSSDLNYETEAAESIISPSSQKKRIKKHSSRKSNEKQIKDEPISMDLDDAFPTCNSQK